MGSRNDDERKDEFFPDEDDFDFEDDFDIDENAYEPASSIDDTIEQDEDNAEDKITTSDKNQPQLSDEEIAKNAMRKAMARKKRKELIRKARLPLAIGAIALICVVIGVGAYGLSTIDENKIMNNVYIENLDVGGLSYDDALASINATYLFENSELTLTNGKKTFTISGSDIGLSAMPEETAKKAFDYCKTGNVFDKAFKSVMLMFRPHVIVPAPQIDDERLDEKLNECGNEMVGERKQFYIEYGEEPGTATMYSGQTGYNEDPSVPHRQVIDAISKEHFKNIHVDFTTAPPDEMTIEALDALVYKDPIDARYEIDGNEVNIIPGETGRYLDKEAVTPVLPEIYEGCEPVEITYNISEPNITEDILREKLFSASLSSYSTNYGGSTANRCANVARAASLISGTVVAPGDTFSFNDTVGPRSKANGFYTAKEYIDGRSVDGIGGGTCQVSSTLYSAVLYADMGIVERLNHMMSVGYIPLGQDATVSDGDVDFKFRNTSDYPVKISAYTDGGTITVTILGTAWDPARKVKISNNVTTAGQNTVVYSTRYVYSNDELISTDTLNSSTYMPHQ